MPEFVNCDEYIKLYPSVVGFVKVPAAVWKNPGPQKERKKPITRTERKTRDAIQQHIETGVIKDSKARQKYDRKLNKKETI